MTYHYQVDLYQLLAAGVVFAITASVVCHRLLRRLTR